MVDRKIVEEWVGKADEDFGFARVNLSIGPQIFLLMKLKKPFKLLLESGPWFLRN
jgi:hypothetical protein